MKKKVGIGVLILCFFVFVFLLVNKEENILKENIKKIGAEKSGSSPESGATSKLKTAYDSLVSKGTNYGNTQPSDWIYPSYGTYWDRILHSAAWEPDGTATEDDVLAGKTFYSGLNNRTIKTGVAISGSYADKSLQQYSQYDDAHASDYTGEESTWVKTNTTPATLVWKDTRTGLYWARSEPATKTNGFTIATCDFYTTTPRGSYGASTTDPDCGASINACAVLSLAKVSGSIADTNWYLPSSKELKQAYIDGIFNKTGSSFTVANLFWSSTEYSQNSTYSWNTNLTSAITAASLKSGTFPVMCVLRP